MASATPDPKDLPPVMLDLGQVMHFVAARELLAVGTLSPQTVELLIATSPQPQATINVQSDRLGETRIDASIVGAGRAWNGSWYVDSEKDALKNGELSRAQLEGGILALANAARNHVADLWRKRVAGLKKSSLIKMN